MGHLESRREVHLACDDLDVARRFAGGGPGQRSVELTERGDFRREPAPAAEGGGKVVVVPGREVVVDPIREGRSGGLWFRTCQLPSS